MTGQGVRLIQLAPDGVNGAFVRNDTGIAGLLGMGWLLGVAGETRHVCWFNVDAPDQVESVRVSGQTVSTLNLLFHEVEVCWHGREQLVFSPDSKHVAYSNGTDIVICSAEGEARKFLKHPHKVEDLTWLSADEVAYALVECPGSESDSRVHGLRVYRQKIRTGQDAAEEVLRVDLDGSPQVRWSPCGRYLAYFRRCRGPCYIFDVQTERVQSFGNKGAPIDDISWRPDGSEVLCSGWDESRVKGPPPSRHLEHSFLLIDTEAGTSQEWRYRESLEPGHSLPVLEPADVWTSDGRYVVVTYDSIYPALLDPQSRDWIARSDQLFGAFDRSTTDYEWRFLTIGPLPVPGWVYVDVPAARDRARGTYAMNYDGTDFVRIADGWNWAVTPDGTKSIEVDDEGNLTVRQISLPTGSSHTWSGETGLTSMAVTKGEQVERVCRGGLHAE